MTSTLLHALRAPLRPPAREPAENGPERSLLRDLHRLVGEIRGRPSFPGTVWGRAAVGPCGVAYRLQKGDTTTGRILYLDIPWRSAGIERISEGDGGITEILLGFPRCTVQYVVEATHREARRRLIEARIRSAPICVPTSHARSAEQLITTLAGRGAG